MQWLNPSKDGQYDGEYVIGEKYRNVLDGYERRRWMPLLYEKFRMPLIGHVMVVLDVNAAFASEILREVSREKIGRLSGLPSAAAGCAVLLSDCDVPPRPLLRSRLECPSASLVGSYHSH